MSEIEKLDSDFSGNDRDIYCIFCGKIDCLECGNTFEIELLNEIHGW